MKNGLAIMSVIAASILIVGCMTTKTPVITSTTGTNGVPVYTTNIVVTVNTNNLNTDCLVIQGMVAGGVSVAVSKDASIIPTLKTVQTSLGGVLNGSNTNSVNQIVAVLGKDSNPTIQAELGPLVSFASGLEQQLLNKYGQTVHGQIQIAIARACYAGLVLGMGGAK